MRVDPEPVDGGLQDQLRSWGDIAIGARLSGARNRVRLADMGGRQVVVRQSPRSVDALEWELDLLEHLTEQGVGVPRTVMTRDGRRHAGGVTVWEHVQGDPPVTGADWQLVHASLSRLHSVTLGWSQRPGFAGSRQLLVGDRGGDVRLDLMLPEVVARVRQAWRAIQVGAECVVHGDVNSGNVLIAGGHVVLLDWDEARVDVPWFDLAALPIDVPLPTTLRSEDVETAGIAWEAATCWVAEPEYAGRRVEELTGRI